MLLIREGIGEKSHKQHNLTPTSLQFCKGFQSPSRRVAVRFRPTLLEQFSPLVQLAS